MTDVQLVENYLQGDAESLEILIARYAKRVYYFVYRYVGNEEEAEHIAQEVFVRVWRNLKKFDRKKSLSTWMFAIAKNASFDFLKKKKTIPFSAFTNEEGENVWEETLVDSAPLPNEIIEQKGLIHMLEKAKQMLSPKYQTVLFLHYQNHFTFREISESLGESLDTVKSRHRRALIMLRKLLPAPI